MGQPCGWLIHTSDSPILIDGSATQSSNQSSRRVGKAMRRPHLGFEFPGICPHNARQRAIFVRGVARRCVQRGGQHHAVSTRVAQHLPLQLPQL